MGEPAQQPDSEDPLRVVPFDGDAKPERAAVPRHYEGGKRFNVHLSARSRDALRKIAEDMRMRGIVDPLEPPGIGDILELVLAEVGGRNVDWRRVQREMTEDRAAEVKTKSRTRRAKG